MNYDSLLPTALIQAIIASDNATGNPELPPGGRDDVECWLRRVLVDFDAFEIHTTYLREHMRISDRRRPADKSSGSGTPFERAIGALYPGFRHNRALDEALAFAVVRKGLEVLDDTSLARLVLNPVALDDLAVLIQDQPSGGWSQALAQAGQERLAAGKRTIPPPSPPSPPPAEPARPVAGDNSQHLLTSCSPSPSLGEVVGG